MQIKYWLILSVLLVAVTISLSYLFLVSLDDHEASEIVNESIERNISDIVYNVSMLESRGQSLESPQYGEYSPRADGEFYYYNAQVRRLEDIINLEVTYGVTRESDVVPLYGQVPTGIIHVSNLRSGDRFRYNHNDNIDNKTLEGNLSHQPLEFIREEIKELREEGDYEASRTLDGYLLTNEKELSCEIESERCQEYVPDRPSYANADVKVKTSIKLDRELRPTEYRRVTERLNIHPVLRLLGDEISSTHYIIDYVDDSVSQDEVIRERNQ